MSITVAVAQAERAHGTRGQACIPGRGSSKDENQHANLGPASVSLSVSTPRNPVTCSAVRHLLELLLFPCTQHDPSRRRAHDEGGGRRGAGEGLGGTEGGKQVSGGEIKVADLVGMLRAARLLQLSNNVRFLSPPPPPPPPPPPLEPSVSVQVRAIQGLGSRVDGCKVTRAMICARARAAYAACRNVFGSSDSS